MAHGYPDYGAAAPKEELYAGLDLAELAARLGATSRYDRLGDTLFLEGWEGDIGSWEPEIDGLGASVAVTAERKATGSFSLKMVGGSTLNRYAGIIGRLPVPYSLKYGWEWVWTLDEDMEEAYCLITIYTGALRLKFGIRYTIATEQNAYFNSGGGWTDIGAPVHPLFSSYNFIVAKFTVDISTGKYSRFLVPPMTFPIAGLSGEVVVDTLSYPRMEINGRITSDPLKNAVSYLDSFAITANDV